MSHIKVKEYFNKIGIPHLFCWHEEKCDTVPHAAEVIGCTEGEIAKTMSFLVDEQPICIVCAGDVKISNPKYKSFFGKKAKMVPWDTVEEIIGHEPGGVCPFALNENVKVYLDVSLKRLSVVHAAAGAIQATATMTVPELEKYSCCHEWIDVCELIEKQ